ncbi:MAG: hypothetical protein GY829_15680, partial [Gammaproteobacteria bacterium]|nr:hypothetical protein [Gammaproteobacteria bacterium]
MASVPVSATSLSGLGASNILSNAPEGSVLSGVVTDAKQQEVKARSLQKRLSLEFKRIQIGQSDILDADSIRMPDTGEILRLGSNKSGTAFDAFEVAHPNAPPVTDAEQAKRNIKKEARQRIAAANVLGKSPYEVTTEDINKLGEQGRQEAVKAITAGQEPTYRTDFDEAEDAQFAVDVRAVGEGIYGRPLVELRNSATGADINSDLNTRAINASYDTVYNQKKRHEDIARIYAEQEIADEKSKTRRIESVYLGGKDIGLPVSIGGGEYRALSNKEADTFGGAVTDTTGRLLAAGTGIIAMAVDLPLAGVEFLFDNLSATKAFKKDAEGNVIEVEDEKYLSAMRDIAMYQEQVRDQRTAVATAFSKGQEFFQLLTNNRNQEETIKALTKVYENETFGRDFIGVLSNNPKSVLEFVVDSLPFMYAAAKKGVAMPFAAAFTGENYKVGTELYAKEFGHEPEAKAKALILTGSAFIAALNSAGAKYVTGEWAGRAFLNKIGIEGVGNFLKATSIRLGSKVPESQLKTLSALLLEGTTIAAKQSLILATKASVEFLQEGSEGLITAASVRQSLNFTNDELRDASISGAIGFASGGTAPILFAGTHSSVKLAQSGANGTRSLIKSRDLNKRVSEFRNDTDFV